MEKGIKIKKKLKLNLFGSFYIIDPSGKSIEIASKKGRALIAILAIAPNGERARSWLQAQLWGRGSSQDSLRKELSKLRTIFDRYSLEIIPRNIPRDLVRLDLSFFDVDLFDVETSLKGEFLEGFELSSEQKFVEWLKEVRETYNGLKKGMVPNLSSDDGATLDVPISEIMRHASPSRFCIGISPIQLPDYLKDNRVMAKVEDLVDRIGKLLLCSGGVDLVDHRVALVVPNITTIDSLTSPQAQLITKISETSRGIVVVVQLILNDSLLVICAPRCELDYDTLFLPDYDESVTQTFVAEAVDEMLYKLSRNQNLVPNDGHSALKLVHEAVDGMFQLSYNGLDTARIHLEMASEIHNESVIYAWRAYLANHYIDDPRTTNYQQYKDEAKYCAARALEIDRYNPLTLSLLTQVYAFALGDLSTARELMSQAKSLKSDHVMTYDGDALLNLYLGNMKQSRASALKAAQLGKFLSYRYCFFTSLCMIDGLSGNPDSAIYAGERALQLIPSKADRPYSPTLRYLAANYAKIGKYSQASKLLTILQESHDKIASKPLEFEHVSPSLEISEFLKIGHDTLSS